MDLQKFKTQAIHFTLKSKHQKRLKDVFKKVIEIFTDENDVYDFKDVENEIDIKNKVDELCSGGVFNLTWYQRNKLYDILNLTFRSCA